MPSHPVERERRWLRPEVPPEPYWSPDPILAYRVFTWSLQSIRGVSGRSWDSYRLTAECHAVKDDDETVPPHLPGDNWRCIGNCGIYAFKHADKLLYEVLETPWIKRLTRGLPPHGLIVPEGLYAVVRLTGRVIEAREGYRAQHAEVVGLVLPDDRRVWSVTDPEPIRALFDDPTKPSEHPSWTHRDVASAGALPITMLEELERIADEHR